MTRFAPHYEILPSAQRCLLPELVELPRHFVLYGGTALALRLGHRASVDFDFFTSEPFVPLELLSNLRVLAGAKVLQNVGQTLTVMVERDDGVKLSFVGALPLKRVGDPELTQTGELLVASLLDLAGTKAAVVTQRVEAKDYIDILALLENGISLGQAMAAARTIYGPQYNPALTVKSLAYFGDGDLHRLSPQQKALLLKAATEQSLDLPNVPEACERLSPPSERSTRE